MLAPSGELLRAGLGLKLNQVKIATRSYLRDRTHQASDSVTSYAVAAGLLATAGIFLIAACLVGITALFRWIEINDGLFPAFGATGALLLVISAICAGIPAARLKRRPREFPSLSSRLRVAVKASPLRMDHFGDYGATYGSLGAAIGLMMWMWMSATIVLYGAELNSEIERRTGAGSTSGAAPDRGTTVAR